MQKRFLRTFDAESRHKRGTGYDETSLINNLVCIDDGDDVYARPCC